MPQTPWQDWQRDDQAASSVLTANRSITLPLCPPRQIADSWILFISGAMPLGDKANQSGVTAESCNSETVSDDHAAKRGAASKSETSIKDPSTWLKNSQMTIFSALVFTGRYTLHEILTKASSKILLVVKILKLKIKLNYHPAISQKPKTKVVFYLLWTWIALKWGDFVRIWTLWDGQTI